MIVMRCTLLAKPWRENELVESLKEWGELAREHLPPDVKYRIYRSRFGPAQTVAWEVEVESVEQWEGAWQSMFSNPDIVRLASKQTTDLTERGGSFEVWHLYDQE